MRADQTQELDYLLAFLDVQDEALFTLDAAGIQVKFTRQIHQRLAVLLIHRSNLQMVRGSFRIVNRSSSHKCPAQIRAFAAVLADNLRIDPIGEDETLGDDPQILENLLDTAWDSNDIDVILLQTHFFTHEQLDMDLVIFLK
ncbi:hypothetical protein D3C87_1796980 [compost metagenome]